MPAPDGSFILKDVVDWLWAAVAALIGAVYKLLTGRFMKIEARQEHLEHVISTKVDRHEWERHETLIREDIKAILNRLDQVIDRVIDAVGVNNHRGGGQ